MRSHHWARPIGQPLQRRAEVREPAVAHGDGYVAQEARIFGALDWALGVKPAELRLGQGSELIEPRSKMPRRERRLGGQWRLPIPRAHILADVAAKHMLPDP